ncbi:10 kDa chaperonin-like [Hibiscus syriacus]|uniref:10 kDa chaperonin-like n=1 Tax=Hibiscus syriacus TaxID=106335 RepID=A0A6A2Y0J0_HIBSY|nr:10 kDa chaperonin-like [Hibiscus syriacus]
MIKINVDGAYSKESNMAAIGIVACDSYGMVLGGMTKNIDPPFTAEFTEAAVFTHGIQLKTENGWTNMAIKCDAISVVYRLSNQSTNKTHDISTVGLLLNEARSLLVDSPSFKVHYVCREANRVAHTLAQWALSNHNPVWFFLDELDCIKQLELQSAVEEQGKEHNPNNNSTKYQTGALTPLIRWLSQGMQRAAAPPHPPRPAARAENVTAAGRQGNENTALAGEENENLAADDINQAVENENEADPALGNAGQWWGIVKEIQMIVFSFITSLHPGFHNIE